MINYVVRSGHLVENVREASPKLAALAIMAEWQWQKELLGSVLIVSDIYFVTALLLEEVKADVANPKLKIYCENTLA